tara:strand:- start:354 stop:536 length:183 start_codon:yes stop_codon:yes gene_type:complete
MSIDNKELHEEILDLIRKRIGDDEEYINPHFMQEITRSVYDYYEIEDDKVDDWIIEMFGA